MTGLVSDPIDELELMSPWGTELQDDSTGICRFVLFYIFVVLCLFTFYLPPFTVEG